MSRHRLVPLAAAFLALAATHRGWAVDSPYTDPWEPATEVAAQAASVRLGAKRALDIVPRVLAIQGLATGVAGGSKSIVATIQEVRQAMRDLAARETDLEIRVELPADVLFDFDKAAIRSDAAQALKQLATVIRAYPSGATELSGHTDSKGDDAYNQRLSERRAEAVKSWLVTSEGIPADRLTSRGWGERKPVASNDDDAGRQKNRRVEVVIRKQ
jgi:outer membrane protein OmpA-like peptidoglycan-associated protein